MSIAKATASISAQNIFTDWVKLRGDFNVSISGVTDSTVTIQRTFDGGSTPLDVDSFTSDQELQGFEPEPDVEYRIGIKTGDYGTDTVAVRLSR